MLTVVLFAVVVAWAVLSYLGQAPFQNKALDFMFQWEVDRWNEGGSWKRWIEFRKKWIKDI